MPSLDAAIDLFLDHVKLERGLRKNSVAAYAQDLARFRAFAEGAGLASAEAVETRHLLAYLVTRPPPPFRWLVPLARRLESHDPAAVTRALLGPLA